MTVINHLSFTESKRGWFDSAVITLRSFSHQNNWQIADAVKTVGQNLLTVPFQQRNDSPSQNLPSPYSTNGEALCKACWLHSGPAWALFWRSILSYSFCTHAYLTKDKKEPNVPLYFFPGLAYVYIYKYIYTGTHTENAFTLECECRHTNKQDLLKSDVCSITCAE